MASSSERTNTLCSNLVPYSQVAKVEYPNESRTSNYSFAGYVKVECAVEKKFSTQSTSLVNSVCYCPENQCYANRYLISSGIVYVVRLKTRPSKASDEGVVFCDVYVYSNPMAHLFDIVDIVKVKSPSAEVVPYSSISKLGKEIFQVSIPKETYDEISRIQDRFEIDLVHLQPEHERVDEDGTRHCGGFIPKPQKINRDVYDTVSIFYRDIVSKLQSMHTTVTDDLVPLCFTRVLVSAFILIVRLLSLPDKNIYDAHIHVCTY